MKKRWILVVLTVLFLWLVVSRFTELEQLRATLAQGQLRWVLAALALQAVYYVVFSASYQAAFATVGIQTRTRDLIPLTLGALFVNLVVPAGATGGAALFADDLARRGKSPAGAAAGVLLQLTADFGAFILLLIPGLTYLFIVHDLKVYEVVAAIILLGLTLGLALIFGLGVWRADWLHRLFAWSQRTANGLFGLLPRSLRLADDWAQKNAQEFSQAAAAAASSPVYLAQTVGLAFVAHLVDVAVLYLLFVAFHQPISFGALIAGYAIGILFWIVSITPMGVGVVEGLMALTFTSLGIPGASAATITLVYRGLTFWIPMLVGFVAVQRLHTIHDRNRALTAVWGVRFAAVLVALVGVVNVLSAITPSLAERVRLLEQALPLVVRQGSHLAAALAGFALLLLAGGLWRRKRTAWALTVVALAVSAGSHLAKGLDYEEASVSLALLALLLALRAHFQARSDPPSMRQGLKTLAQALLFTLAYGTAGLYLLDRHFQINFSLGAAIRQTVVMFTQFSAPGLEPITGFGRYFAASIYAIGAITVTYALLMLIQPVLVRQPAGPAEQARAAAIVAEYGRSSLARFALLPDKTYFFSPGGSVIAYTVKGRVALALGDPIGPEADFPAVLAAFKELCTLNDWRPAFYQVLPDHLEDYRAAGFDLLCIGQEGIVHLESFSLQGHENKPLRAPVNHLTKIGYQACYNPPPQPPELLAKLRLVSNEWLAAMHGSEKRFSLGWFDDDYITGSPVMVIETPEGDLAAFANLVPEYRRSEVTIDLMRHRQEAPPGTMDFLFVKLFEWAKSAGYETFNLGLSALSGIGEDPHDPVIEKALRMIYQHIDRFYNFKGLHEFKNKFHPEWSPRYLVYPGLGSLADVAVALARADSGDDLLDYFRK